MLKSIPDEDSRKNASDEALTFGKNVSDEALTLGKLLEDKALGVK